MQTFVLETFENNYHILNQLCSSCGIEFYRQPELAAGIVGTGMQMLSLILFIWPLGYTTCTILY